MLALLTSFTAVFYLSQEEFPKKLNKFLSAAVACAMAMSMCATSAFALGVPGHVVEGTANTSSGSTNVTATVTGAYTITVPQTVTLTGADGTGEKSATIAVNVKGDIAENQVVTVKTTAPTMKCTGAKDVVANVNAPKTTWTRTDVIANANAGTTSNYTVSATLTPGEWTGTAVFACTLGTAAA